MDDRRAFLKFLAASPLVTGLGLTGQALAQGPAPELVTKASDALDVFDLEKVAHRNIPVAHWGYLMTGVDGEETLTANRAAYGRWQLRTDPQVGAYVRRMLQVKPMRLTRAALETLAIIAYRQPITRPEMEELRGVDCGAVTKALLERKLIRILGKKDEPGRPLLYGSSKEFLELFNLRDLTQLPTLREFQELSEESRKIVEEEAPSAPPVAGLTELAHDPAVAERIAQATVESETALAQLESAMEQVEETTRTAAAVLAPPAPPPEAPPAAPAQEPSAPAEEKE